MKSAEKSASQKQLDLQQAALDDRQKALNDKRMLHGIHDDAMDALRRDFLLNCPVGASGEAKAK